MWGTKGFSGAMNVAPTPGASDPLCKWAVALCNPRSLSRHPPQTLYVSSPHLSRHPRPFIRHPRSLYSSSSRKRGSMDHHSMDSRSVPGMTDCVLDSHFRGNDKGGEWE